MAIPLASTPTIFSALSAPVLNVLQPLPQKPEMFSRRTGLIILAAAALLLFSSLAFIPSSLCYNSPMPKSPWISFAPVAPGRNYLALISYLPLRHHRALPNFFRYTFQTRRQLKTTAGLLGYAMEAKPWSLQSWTISVWEDQQSLNNFVRQIPHSRIMQALAPHMGRTQFAQWSVTAAEIPLDWTAAKTRLNPS
jgi:hypothetical protein